MTKRYQFRSLLGSLDSGDACDLQGAAFRVVRQLIENALTHPYECVGSSGSLCGNFVSYVDHADGAGFVVVRKLGHSSKAATRRCFRLRPRTRGRRPPPDSSSPWRWTPNRPTPAILPEIP